MTDDDNNHANAVNEQLRQVEEGDGLPESSADRSSIRLLVDGEKLHADNPIDYLVMLLLEGTRYDGNWDGDQQQVAQWAVAQWCQEIGWVPDLADYAPGEQVGRGDEIGCCDEAFYDHGDVDREELEAVLDDVEETVVDEDMTGASREQVARGTIQRVRRRLQEVDDAE